MLSLRDTLRKLETREDFQLHRDLRSWPPSLRELIRIVNLPPPDLRHLQWHKIHDYEADDAQGIAHGRGTTWFMSSKSEIRAFRITGPATAPSITEIASIALDELLARTDLEGSDLDVDHIGGVAFGHDLLFIPVEPSSTSASSLPHFVLATDESFNVVGYTRLSAKTRSAWCAFNEWTGLLYMSHKSDASKWSAFDASGFVERAGEPREAWGHEVSMTERSDREYALIRSDGDVAVVEQTQGIAFSSTGTVYVTRYVKETFSWTNFVEVFSSLTGRRFSDATTPVISQGPFGPVLVDSPVPAGIRRINFSGVFDEIEGAGFHPGGAMYVTVADHDVDADDYDLYVFSSESDRPL